MLLKLDMLKNNSTKKVISKEITICKTPWQKLCGLMFSKPKCLVFEFSKIKKRDFHMFFVFFPIDIAFLDEEKRIVEIKRNFLPFTTYTSKRVAKYVIETPQGMLSEVSMGNKFDWDS